MPDRPAVLMVTGAYYPELSGAGLQCRALMARLGGEVDFAVLTTTTDRRLPSRDIRDGVPVERIFVDPGRFVSKAKAGLQMLRVFPALVRRVAIVHFHGFSQKSILLVLLAIASGRKVAIKLTSFGDDDPMSVAERSWVRAWCYRRAHMFFAVSPRFRESYDAAGLPGERFKLIPNGVDLARFRPPEAGERASLRRDLNIPEEGPVVLFVGFFSRDKQPDMLFEAWTQVVRRTAPTAVLVFVGATRSAYHEVDPRLAEDIRAAASRLGLAHRICFVESTLEIERFHRAADIFVLPSRREGMPNALLEAMASGAACVVTRLEGITDRLIADGHNGVLVPAGDRGALVNALGQLAADPARRAALGVEARRTIESRYGLDCIADQYLDAYKALMGSTPCAA